MTGVCSSVKIYENMNSIHLGSVVAPEGKTQLSKLGCRDAWVSCRGWDQGDRLPAHSWWALVRVYVASEMGKEVSWILSESPWRLHVMARAGGAQRHMAELGEVPGAAVGHRGPFAGLICCPGSFAAYWGLGSGILWRHYWVSSVLLARSPTTFLHGHLCHSQGRSGSCQEWLRATGARAKDTEVHCCLLRPTGEVLREGWTDSSVLHINKCLHSWCWNTGIWLLGPWDLLWRWRTAKKR